MGKSLGIASVALFVLLCAPISMGDEPESFTWVDAPGGSVTASVVDFDTWMELLAEFLYDDDPPFDVLDPNGEPDGIPERNGWAEGVLDPCDENQNYILDATELAVLAAICSDQNHPMHDVVHDAFKANVERCRIDLGTLVETLGPPMRFVMAAFVTLGDGDYSRFNYEGTDYLGGHHGSWGFYAEAIYTLRDYLSTWHEGQPVKSNYQLLSTTLCACQGDADSDGIANINEFYGQGQDRLSYVAAATSQAITVSAPDPYLTCATPQVNCWGVDFFYEPSSKFVYHLTASLPWLVSKSYAESFSIGGTPVAAHLTTIRSATQNQWLTTNVVAVTDGNCAIGGTDKDAEGVWKWVENGAQFWQGDFSGHSVLGRYANWNGNEPNNMNEEDCAQIRINGDWNDIAITSEQPAIVEFTNGGAGYADSNPQNGLPDWWEPYIAEGGEGEGEGEVDPDRDDDGMPNAWETIHGLNPDDPSDAAGDADSDGLTNLQEFQRMTRPNDADTDDDGLGDGVEATILLTNPLDSDSDNDGVLDGAEVNTHMTNPLLQDTDADGMPDGFEIDHGLNPLIDDSTADPDGDTLTNLEEYQIGCDPLDGDTDDDTLSDADEVRVYQTDPVDADTDGDGLDDGNEVNVYHTDPINKDTDGDYLNDGDEILNSTDPFDVDTDDDFYNDRLEVYYGANPLDPNDPVQPKRTFAIGGIELLFQDPARNVYFPVWSSNGRRVAFITRAEITWETDVFVTDLDGMIEAKKAGKALTTTRITAPGELIGWQALAWSPDGSVLLYEGPNGKITRKSSMGDGVYFSPIPTPYGLGIGIHTTSLPDNNRLIFSSGGNLYVCQITPSAGIVAGPFMVFQRQTSEETRFVRLNADGTKAVFNIRPNSDISKGDLYLLDLQPILDSTVPVPYGIADGISLGVITTIENKEDYAQCPSFTNDGEFIIWSEDVAQEYLEALQPADMPYTNFDVFVGSSTGVGVPQQMMFPVDDGQIHMSPGGLRMSYTRDWDLYAVTLVMTQKVEGAYDAGQNEIITDSAQLVQDGSGTELSLPQNVTIDFPPDVEPQITMETPVAPVDDAQVPPDVDAVPVVRTFGPSGTVFSEPIPVTITYTDAQIAGMNEASLRVFVYNPVSGVFDTEIPETDIVTRNLADNSITFLIDHFSTFGVAASKDTDLDGVLDSTDTDDDGDGMPDAVDPMPLDTDNDGYDNVVDPDDDSDGFADADEPGYEFDTDNDGTANATDEDDDGDGIADAEEADTDATYDTDNDGQRNDADTDDDGDWIPDLVEGAADPDSDGLPNYIDTDSDNDGVPDVREWALGSDPYDPLNPTQLPLNGPLAFLFITACWLYWLRKRQSAPGFTQKPNSPQDA